MNSNRGGFANVDLFRRIPTDLTEATSLGAVMSLITILLMAILFVSELTAFLTTDITTDVALDVNEAQTLRINFNVTFRALHCDYVSVDVWDSLGDNRQNITKNVEKWQMDLNGRKRIFAGRNKDVREVKYEEHDATLEEMHENGVHAVVVTKDTFDNFVSAQDYAFVNFYAPWCIWCQRLHPTWEQFAEKVEEEKMPIQVGQVDCVENSALCQAQKIQAFPTVRWFQDGEGVLPDYKSDRTVTAFNSFASRKLEANERYKDWETKAKKADPGKAKRPPPNPNQGRAEHPGCMVSGHINVNRVPGNFHVEAVSVNHNLNAAMTNLSHTVNHLSFGEPELRNTRKTRKVLAKIPDTHKNFSPMDDTDWMTKKFHAAHHHYLKIVSTHFDSNIVKYQYLEQSQEVKYEEEDVPEARWSYDISPMSVTVSRKGRKSWYEFITSLFAIVGGTFTTLGLIDGVLYKAFKSKKL